MKYRLLEEGEIIEEGDEVLAQDTSSIIWNKTRHPGKKVMESYATQAIYRRPIEEPKTKPCSFCGGGCVEDAKFCHRCGKEFPKPLYRLLQVGEKIEEGDEVYNCNNNADWTKARLSVGEVYYGGKHNIYRRKISSFTP